MFDYYSDKIKKISKNLESVKKDAENGVIKNSEGRSTPILMNVNDFISKEEPVDIKTTDPEKAEERNNLYEYYAQIMDAFGEKDFYIKKYGDNK